MKPKITYLPDDCIDEAGDQELRDLLTTCFTQSQDLVFKTRRYWREPYPHRWIIRNEQGALVAHVGVHEKSIACDGQSFRIGGICEVCVHPDSRGRGYVTSMLECVHAWLAEQQFPFSMLFGDPKVYGSSGYVEAKNLHLNPDGKEWRPVKGMVKELLAQRWPETDVHLIGIGF